MRVRKQPHPEQLARTVQRASSRESRSQAWALLTALAFFLLLLAPGFHLAHAEDASHLLEPHPAVQAIQQKKSNSFASAPLTKAPSWEAPLMKLLVLLNPHEGLVVSKTRTLFKSHPRTPQVLPPLRI